MLIATQCPRHRQRNCELRGNITSFGGKNRIAYKRGRKISLQMEMNFACRLTLEESEESSTPSL